GNLVAVVVDPCPCVCYTGWMSWDFFSVGLASFFLAALALPFHIFGANSLYLFEVNWAPYVRETVQWYAIASEMRFGKVYDGRGLSVCRRVRLIEVTVVVYGH
ncbi:unnamed protein product, partial [Porites lobata]